MVYTKVTWDETTPLTPANLNVMDDGIADAHERGLRDLVVFESSGTFEKGDYPWLRAVRVVVVGGGGGSGYVDATGAGQSAEAGGGGGGGYAAAVILTTVLDASETVTVGSGGTAGDAAGGNALDGGTSTFSVGNTQVPDVSASGGGAGASMAATSGFAIAAGGDGGAGTAAVSTGSSEKFGVSGSDGGHGLVRAEFDGGSRMNHGGGTVLAGSRSTDVSASAAAGRAGQRYGGGAAGARNGPSSVTQPGAAGADGVVIIYLYG